MDNEKKIIVNIVNRNYPPSKGVTGEAAYELVVYLCEKGFEVNVIHVDILYDGGGNEISPASNVFKVGTFYNGKNKILRLMANLVEGYLLIRTSKKHPCDVTICMTDPPLINLWASLLLRKREWMLWTMDLYPEAFVSSRLISPNNFLYKKINKLLLRGAPQHIISLGTVQKKYLQEKYKDRVTSYSLLPCGIYNAKDKIDTGIPRWANDRNKVYLGYCGNLGEAHSLEFLYAIVNNLDADKFKLILAPYGSKSLLLKKYAQDKRGIEIVESVQRSHLRFIDIHLASLSNEWTNVCVPSKTVSSVCSGSAFLYFGDEHSDNWILLQDAGWLLPWNENVEDSVRKFFSAFQYEELVQKKGAARKIAEKLNFEKTKTFHEIADKISELNNIKRGFTGNINRRSRNPAAG
ncbi:MAG: hypothetical protein LBQ22_02705 [Bacteroidales bacterium]|jgi:hypothetical protein|nr:hypothetical protein [Bacteroidales bacterium]